MTTNITPTLLHTYKLLWEGLIPLYGDHEAKAIARVLLEDKYKLTLNDIYAGSASPIPEATLKEIEHDLERLQTGEPVQYVVGSTWFMGRQFKTHKGVLIPRPETQVLVEQAVNHLTRYRTQTDPLHVLDIGTGSGCIAVSVAALCPQCEVTAWDISDTALDTATDNAKNNHVTLNVVRKDALQALPDPMKWDVIVSNPPYICIQEQDSMEKNVLQFEPHIALFVPDDDPLRFYRAITEYARLSLKHDGLLAYEVNTAYAEHVKCLMLSAQLQDVEIVMDMYDQPRIVKGRKI